MQYIPKHRLTHLKNVFSAQKKYISYLPSLICKEGWIYIYQFTNKLILLTKETTYERS